MKKRERKIDRFRKKLMIPESEIEECPKFEAKSKIGNILVNKKILEECSVRIYKIDPFFTSMKKQKKKTGKNRYDYIFFRIDVCFTEYL